MISGEENKRERDYFDLSPTLLTFPALSRRIISREKISAQVT